MADWAGIAWKSEKPLAATRVAVSTKRKRAAQSDASRKRSPSPLVVRPALRLRLGSRSAESNAEASALLNAVAAERGDLLKHRTAPPRARARACQPHPARSAFPPISGSRQRSSGWSRRRASGAVDDTIDASSDSCSESGVADTSRSFGTVSHSGRSSAHLDSSWSARRASQATRQSQSQSQQSHSHSQSQSLLRSPPRSALPLRNTADGISSASSSDEAAPPPRARRRAPAAALPPGRAEWLLRIDETRGASAGGAASSGGLGASPLPRRGAGAGGGSGAAQRDSTPMRRRGNAGGARAQLTLIRRRAEADAARLRHRLVSSGSEQLSPAASPRGGGALVVRLLSARDSGTHVAALCAVVRGGASPHDGARLQAGANVYALFPRRLSASAARQALGSGRSSSSSSSSSSGGGGAGAARERRRGDEVAISGAWRVLDVEGAPHRVVLCTRRRVGAV